VLHPIAESININDKVWSLYFRVLIPQIVKQGDDGNSGSSAVCDVTCLQVHFISFLLVEFISKFKWFPGVAQHCIFIYFT